MKPELKKRWVKALRSGKFKKGKYQLRWQTEKGDVYCCLGVLCAIEGVKWKKVVVLETVSYGVSGDIGSLAPSRQKQFGISDDVQGKLIKMNDVKNHSFAHIATWVEKNL